MQRKYGSMTTYRTTRYEYDDNYNVDFTCDGASNWTYYTFDDNNRLSQINRGPFVTTFDYDEVGNRTNKTLPSGAYTDYTYNSRNWLTDLENRKGDNTLVSSYEYTHDDAGNRLTMTEANGDVTTWVYDDVYRLVSEEKGDGEDVIWRYEYTYDGVGNRLTMDNEGFVTYTYDSNNKLTQLVGPSGTTTFDYDDNGNMTEMDPPGAGNWDYQYDYENRLIGVTDNSAYTGTYTYSGDGLRLRVQETNHAYTDRWLQYDGVRPVLEGTLSGDTYTTTAKYVWEGNSRSLRSGQAPYDPLLFALEGGAWKHPMYDGLGSTRQLLDNTTQNVTDEYAYEAFGNLMDSTGSTPNPYRYVGALGYYRTGGGFFQTAESHYDATIARFISSDEYSKGRQHGTAWYSYVMNNPVNDMDPTGLWGIIPRKGEIQICIGPGWAVCLSYQARHACCCEDGQLHCGFFKELCIGPGTVGGGIGIGAGIYRTCDSLEERTGFSFCVSASWYFISCDLCINLAGHVTLECHLGSYFPGVAAMGCWAFLVEETRREP